MRDRESLRSKGKRNALIYMPEQVLSIRDIAGFAKVPAFVLDARTSVSLLSASYVILLLGGDLVAIVNRRAFRFN